jgi:hypothetical protein
MGKTLIKAGGVIAALGGVADGVGSGAASARSVQQGDVDAGRAHAFSALLSILGGAFGGAGAIGSGALLGPLGIGIAFSLVAFVAKRVAERMESDALELWARRSYFGRGEASMRWAEADQMDFAISALNAAVIGMDASLGFDSAKRAVDVDELMVMDILLIKETGGIETGVELAYRIFLPHFDPLRSRYEFTLSIQRFGVARTGRRAPTITSSVLTAAYHNSPNGAPHFDTMRELTPGGTSTPNEGDPVLRGKYWLEPMHAIKTATVEIMYWPDKDDASGLARLRLTEEA